jgi:hypothetical protein
MPWLFRAPFDAVAAIEGQRNDDGERGTAKLRSVVEKSPMIGDSDWVDRSSAGIRGRLDRAPRARRAGRRARILNPLLKSPCVAVLAKPAPSSRDFSADQPPDFRSQLAIEKSGADCLVRSKQLYRRGATIPVPQIYPRMSADNVVYLLFNRADLRSFFPCMAKFMEYLIDPISVKKSAEPLGCLVCNLEFLVGWTRSIKQIFPVW